MSDKLNIEQLISAKLGEAELTPSQDAWKGIQRKLRWKKFLRFHTRNFNIYYLAGVMIVVGALLGVRFSGSSDHGTVEQSERRTGVQIEEQSSRDISETLPESPKSSEVQNQAQKKEENPAQSFSEIEADPETPAKKSLKLHSESAVMLQESNEDLENTEIEPDIVLPESAPAESLSKNQEEVKHVTFFTSSEQSGCAPLEVQFYNQSDEAVSYNWSFGNVGQSSSRDPYYLFEEADTYVVTLQTENVDGLSSIHQQTVEVYELPSADFDIDKGFAGLSGHVTLNLLNYSSGANSYAWCLLTEDLVSCGHWTSEEFQPPLFLTDLKNGADQMRLVASSEYGCVDTVVKALPIRVESNDVKIKFATAFSPNPTGPGDGTFGPGEKRIDLFHPVFLEVPVEYHLRVYTKRGEVVFETRDAYQGWDGYFHEERSAGGVYVWMLEGTWINGESFKLQGDVTLIWQDIW